MPLALTILITAVLAGGLGLLLGWLWGRGGRATVPADSRLEDELRQQVAQRESELNRLRG